jgi:hypothetical protein
MLSHRLLCALTLTLLACGGTVKTAAQDASMNDALSDAAPIDAAADASESGPARACPPTVPEAGTLCTGIPGPPFGPQWPCEYGSDPQCTTIAYCDTYHGTWYIEPPNALCNGNPAGCPSTFDPDAGWNGPTPCPTQGSCWYPQGSCACVPCLTGNSNMPICASLNLCGGDAGDADASSWHSLPAGTESSDGDAVHRRLLGSLRLRMLGPGGSGLRA